MPLCLRGIGLNLRDDDVKVEFNLCWFDEGAGDLESGIRVTQFSLLVAPMGPEGGHISVDDHVWEVPPRNSVNRLHAFVPSPVVWSLAKRSDGIDFSRSTSRE